MFYLNEKLESCLKRHLHTFNFLSHEHNTGKCNCKQFIQYNLHVKTSYIEENTLICTLDYQTDYSSVILENWLFIDSWGGQTAENNLTSSSVALQSQQSPPIKCTFYSTSYPWKMDPAVFFSFVLNILQLWIFSSNDCLREQCIFLH